MTADFPVDKEKMRSLIDYYKSVPERYTTGHKADVRLRYAALFNICKIYLFMEEPEKVGSYADMLTENGYDTKDAVKLIQAADELQALFNKTGIRTRHFNPARYFSGE
jgi:regulatory protein YycI of two-component signal transduction system YycFG